jgi:hypothetical protein
MIFEYDVTLIVINVLEGCNPKNILQTKSMYKTKK